MTLFPWPMARPSETRVYDLVHNQGFVNVGIDHDTAEFAVESIRRWWVSEHPYQLAKPSFSSTLGP